MLPREPLSQKLTKAKIKTRSLLKGRSRISNRLGKAQGRATHSLVLKDQWKTW